MNIAGFNFAESSILANIYGRALKQRGYAIAYKLNLGNREVVEHALERRERSTSTRVTRRLTLSS